MIEVLWDFVSSRLGKSTAPRTQASCTKVRKMLVQFHVMGILSLPGYHRNPVYNLLHRHLYRRFVLTMTFLFVSGMVMNPFIYSRHDESEFLLRLLESTGALMIYTAVLVFNLHVHRVQHLTTLVETFTLHDRKVRVRCGRLENIFYYGIRSACFITMVAQILTISGESFSHVDHSGFTSVPYRPLPLTNVWIPLLDLSQPLCFYIAYVSLLYCMVVFYFMVSNLLTMYPIYLIYQHGQYRVLNKYLSYIGHRGTRRYIVDSGRLKYRRIQRCYVDLWRNQYKVVDTEGQSKEWQDRLDYSNVRQAVQFHQKLISFQHKFNRSMGVICSPIVITWFVSTIISLFELTRLQSHHDPNKLIRVCSEFLMTMTCYFYACFASETLAQCEAKLHLTMYTCDWVHLLPRTRRAVQLFLFRTQRDGAYMTYLNGSVVMCYRDFVSSRLGHSTPPRTQASCTKVRKMLVQFHVMGILSLPGYHRNPVYNLLHRHLYRRFVLTMTFLFVSGMVMNPFIYSRHDESEFLLRLLESTGALMIYTAVLVFNLHVHRVQHLTTLVESFTLHDQKVRVRCGRLENIFYYGIRSAFFITMLAQILTISGEGFSHVDHSGYTSVPYRPLPLINVWIPLLDLSQPLCFYIAYVSLLYCMVVFYFMVSNLLTMYPIYLIYQHGQYSVLNKYLSYIGHRGTRRYIVDSGRLKYRRIQRCYVDLWRNQYKVVDTEGQSKEWQDRLDYSNVRQAIQFHQKLISFQHEFNRSMGVICSPIVISWFLSTIISIYELTRLQSHHDLDKLIRVSSEFLMTMTCYFYACFASETLAQCEAKLRLTMYTSDWVHLLPRTRRAVQLFLSRTQRDGYLNYFSGSVVMCYRQYGHVLKMTYSFVNFMNLK
ncbi:hypothetical protein M8J75_008863 [Diaphorina citri]|nr:hypothetical protein M8J75_008863 [Diaphorina citri]